MKKDILSPLEKEVLTCWVLGIKSPKKIAERLGRNRSSVRVALYRLRKKGIIKKVEVFSELESLITMTKRAIIEGEFKRALMYLNQMEVCLKALARSYEIVNPEVIRWRRGNGTRG